MARKCKSNMKDVYDVVIGKRPQTMKAIALELGYTRITPLTDLLIESGYEIVFHPVLRPILNTPTVTAAILEGLIP